jgi:hypothetical protein
MECHHHSAIKRIDRGSHGFARSLKLIKQPTSSTCWATAFTMMYKWKHGTSLAIRDALATVGPEYVAMFDDNRALFWADTDKFMKEAGLSVEPSMNSTLEKWVSLLDTHGPIMLNYFIGRDPTLEKSSHLVVMVGIETDGSTHGSTVWVADPATRQMSSQPFTLFASRFEKFIILINAICPQIYYWRNQ